MSTENSGDGVHIGIIDSLGAVPEHLDSRHESIEVYDHYLNEDVDDVSGHGTTVATLVSDTAYQVSISLFRVWIEPTQQGEAERPCSSCC